MGPAERDAASRSAGVTGAMSAALVPLGMRVVKRPPSEEGKNRGACGTVEA